MDKPAPTDLMLTAAECAARIGISVRALRVFENNGLMSPVRTEKNWRLYGAGDIARLNEIMLLKQLGLTLSGISGLLSGQATDLDRLLEMQECTLLKRCEQAEHSLRLVTRLRAKSGSGDRLSMEDLLELAKETQMSDVANEFAWKRYEQTRPRTEIAVDPRNLADCAGEYVFDDGIVMRVEEGDGCLSAEVLGQPRFDLHAEALDQYFLKVTPGQVSFSRNADGAVDSLTLHQGGFEMVAPRCAAGSFEKTKARLEQRVKTGAPLPDSEAALRKVIADHRAGKPDYDSMSPLLASLVKEQLTMVKAELDRMGEVTGITFRGVGAEGYDIFVVDLQQGRLEWGVSLGDNGKMNGLYVRPTP